MEWIDNKYKVVETLGSGTFSDVFLVEGPAGTGLSALKLLKTEVTLSPNMQNLACFKNEFSILKNLNHPNIARILDFGLDEKLMQYYFTSEFIEGKDIFTMTEGLPVKTIIEYFVQAFRALEYLHSYRIFHLDIKAANLMITKAGILKMIDFGLASLDPKGKLIGTPSYMAPEIIRHERPDGRADIYSLGVLWYYCLTRTNPFRTGDVQKTTSRQLSHLAEPPSNINPEIPAYLDQIIKRMLEKRPLERYETASQIIKDLNLLGKNNFETETSETLLSYIPEKGRFIGRKKEIGQIKTLLSDLAEGKNEHSTIMVSGKAGSGKGRFLDEVKYYAQLNDLPVEIATARDPQLALAWTKKIEASLKSGTRKKLFILSETESIELYPSLLGEIQKALSILQIKHPGPAPMVIFGLDSESGIKQTLSRWTTLNIELENFSRDETEEYLKSLTGLTTVPLSFTDEILKRTGGNPLFITELVKTLIKSGELFDSKGRWKEVSFVDIGVDVSQILPENIRDFMLKAYHSLSDREKAILDNLAVAGHPSNSYEISSWTEQGDISHLLEELLRKDFLVREEGYKYYFRNNLLPDFICDEMAINPKRKIHDVIAKHLSNKDLSSEELIRHLGNGTNAVLAFNSIFEIASKFLKEGNGKKALEFLVIAEKRREEASPKNTVELCLKLGEAYLISENYDRALECFFEADDILSSNEKTDENKNWQIDNLIKIGGTYIKLREFEKAHGIFQKIKSLFNQDTDRSKSLITRNFEGYLEYNEGNYNEAEKIYRETRDSLSSLTPEDAQKVANNELGMVLIAKGDYAGSLDILTADLNRFLALKDDLLIARCYYNLAQAYQNLGDTKMTVSSLDNAAQISRKIKDIELLLCCYNGLGNIYTINGELEEAKKFYEMAGDLSDQAGDYKSGAVISINIGMINNKMGNMDVAYYEIYPATVFLNNLANKRAFDWQILCRGEMELVDILTKKKDFDEARKHLYLAKECFQCSNDKSCLFWLIYTEVRLLKECGKAAAAGQLIEQLNALAKTKEEIASIAHLKSEPSKTPETPETETPAKRQKDIVGEYEQQIKAMKSQLDEMTSQLKNYEAMMEGSVHGFATKNYYEHIIGRSLEMSNILQIVDKIADTDISVLITGESGTGKELIAKALHLNSARSSNKFVAINCGAIPHTLIESELFGYKAGAFTGAVRDKTGLFEEANNGTIFLDEITDIEPNLQVKLLRVLQEKEFTRIGDTKVRKSDVRIIAATNKNIEDEIKEGRFREDLYWRICQITVHIPPLRERKEDIPLLTKHFIKQDSGPEKKTASPEFLKLLMEYNWPGNIRELENVISVACALSEGDILDKKCLPTASGLAKYFENVKKGGEDAQNRVFIDDRNVYSPNLTWWDYEKIIIARAFEANSYSARNTAKELQIAPTTTYKKIKEFDLSNKSNPLFKEIFVYTRGRSLKSYTFPIFNAAYRHTNFRARKAIANLKVSQGFFYKIMKRKG